MDRSSTAMISVSASGERCLRPPLDRWGLKRSLRTKVSLPPDKSGGFRKDASSRSHISALLDNDVHRFVSALWLEQKRSAQNSDFAGRKQSNEQLIPSKRGEPRITVPRFASCVTILGRPLNRQSRQAIGTRSATLLSGRLSLKPGRNLQ